MARASQKVPSCRPCSPIIDSTLKSLLLGRTAVRHRLRVLLSLLPLPLAACDPLLPSPPPSDDFARGLIVLYPGADNSPGEMYSLYQGLRMAGADQAIEVVPWSGPWEDVFDPPQRLEHIRAWAAAEARRLADFMQSHPGKPVIVAGASAGAMSAIAVAEALPDNCKLDCVVLIAADVSRDYDLTDMLDHTTGGAVSYSSVLDAFNVWAALTIETYDAERTEPAATFGFSSDDPRLVQIWWTPNMLLYGSIGQHLDFALLPDWVRDFIAPEVLHTGR